MREPVTRAEQFGWAMYDFANSSYTTVIVTVYYGVVFTTVLVGDEERGNLLWSLALSASYLLVVVTLPLLGALMDHLGHRKGFLLASTALTVAATAGLGLVGVDGAGAVPLAMLLIVASSYGFSVGESFIASFLPDLAPADKMGRLSGIAWGLGYFGGLGSTLLVLGLLGAPEAGNPAVRWSGPVTAAWFALAAIPTFVWLRDRGRPRPLPPGTSLLTVGFATTLDTLRHARRYRDLMVFLGSHLFAMAGLSIVVSFAFIYGAQVIGWSPGLQAAMFVLTQLAAAVGALGFGWFQGIIGDKRTYAVTLVLWCAAVVLLRATPNVAAATGLDAGVVLLGVGCLAGACMGATQSAARTLVGLLAPPEKVGEFFGLWGTFGKLAAVFGLLSIGALQAALGLRDAILVCGLFFAIGLLTLAWVDVERGRRAAGTR